MQLALAEARSAATRGEVPVGAVVIVDGTLVAAASNTRELAADPTGHAELTAIREAAKVLGRWRLHDATLYVTLEPCPMCAGAIVNARIPRLVYGATDPKAGAVRSLYQLCDDPRLNHRLQIEAGVLAEEGGALLREFFQKKRSRPD
ncbi:MAG: nucleoside deaminase [Deltaproteobacteria bacterium]|nr:nucleoside deaminase [Deltaproteobacteria bacterium]